MSRVAMLHVYNVLFMVQRGEISEQLRARSLVTYVAGLFRSIRFGVAESHGRGAALQLNTFLGSGAVTLDSVTGRYSVQLARLELSVAGLVARLCTLQHTGDREVSVSSRGRGRSSSLHVSGCGGRAGAAGRAGRGDLRQPGEAGPGAGGHQTLLPPGGGELPTAQQVVEAPTSCLMRNWTIENLIMEKYLREFFSSLVF